MRLRAALEGNLIQMMEEELDAAAHGIQRGIRMTSTKLKFELRNQIARTFRNRRRSDFRGSLEKTWQDRYYPNSRIDAAALVYNKAPKIISAFVDGAVIKPKSGRYLAVPNPDIRTGRRHVGRGLDERHRVSPKNWPARLGKLVFIKNHHGGGARLVIDEGKVLKSGRVSFNTRTKKGKLRKGAGPVVAFFLVPQVRIRKRLDIERPIRKADGQLIRNIQRFYK